MGELTEQSKLIVRQRRLEQDRLGRLAKEIQSIRRVSSVDVLRKKD